MTIANWPLNERPREKLYLYGVKNLSNAELLAIFLRTGTRGKTAVDIARELLKEYGSLRKLLNAGPEQLSRYSGMGKAKIAMLKALLELGHRYREEDLKVGDILNDSKRTKLFLINRLCDYPHEVFACLFLDAQNNLLGFEELFHGTLTETTIYPREVVKKALKYNAAKMILVHNHPSGNLVPSEADQHITLSLKKTLAQIEIQVIDHIIVGNNNCLSFAELGLIS